MTPIELAEKMKQAIALLDELADDMDVRAHVCEHCGLLVRENLDDFQAKQAFEAASNRVVRMYDKLITGAWAGRQLMPVVDASAVREGLKGGSHAS
jgi:threonine synthase